MSRRILLALVCFTVVFLFVAPSVTQASPSLAWTVPVDPAYPDAGVTMMQVVNDVRPEFVRSQSGVGMWIYAYGASTPFATYLSASFGYPAITADYDGDGHQEIIYTFDDYASVGTFDPITQQVEWVWLAGSDYAYYLNDAVDCNADGRPELILTYSHDAGGEWWASETRIYTFSASGTALVGEPPTEPEMIGVFPNPTNGKVQFSGLEKSGGTFSVFDTGGRQVRGPQEIRDTQDIGGLPAGTYFLRTTTLNGNKVNRRIVLR